MPQNSVLPAGNNFNQDLNEAYTMLQSGDPQQELQAQMIIDRVNEAVTAMTNFEKAHHDLIQAILNNIGH